MGWRMPEGYEVKHHSGAQLVPSKVSQRSRPRPEDSCLPDPPPLLDLQNLPELKQAATTAIGGSGYALRCVQPLLRATTPAPAGLTAFGAQRP